MTLRDRLLKYVSDGHKQITIARAAGICPSAISVFKNYGRYDKAKWNAKWDVELDRALQQFGY
jgi:hypothetical protein